MSVSTQVSLLDSKDSCVETDIDFSNSMCETLSPLPIYFLAIMLNWLSIGRIVPFMHLSLNHFVNSLYSRRYKGNCFMLYSISFVDIHANNKIFSALNQSEVQTKMQNQRGTLRSVSWSQTAPVHSSSLSKTRYNLFLWFLCLDKCIASQFQCSKCQSFTVAIMTQYAYAMLSQSCHTVIFLWRWSRLLIVLVEFGSVA